MRAASGGSLARERGLRLHRNGRDASVLDDDLERLAARPA